MNTLKSGPSVIFSYVIPAVVIMLTIADFIPDQKIDKYLIGAMLIFGLGALGWRLDDIVGQAATNTILNRKEDETKSDKKAE